MGKGCTCPAPREAADPRRKGSCLGCGKLIGEDCLSSHETLEAFFERLRWALFPTGKPSPAFEQYRALCEARELKGRDDFGLAYLRRDNEQEAGEEAADLAMYMHLSILQARQRGEEEEWSTALEAARHAFIAFEFASQHAHKRKGWI